MYWKIVKLQFSQTTFLTICSFDDRLLLQNSLNNFSERCIKNNIKFKKTNVKSYGFTTAHNFLALNIDLIRSLLTWCHQLKIFELPFNKIYSFPCTEVCKKNLKQFGFIKRLTKDFRSIQLLEKLYFWKWFKSNDLCGQPWYVICICIVILHF